MASVREEIVERAHAVRGKLFRQYTWLMILVGVIPLLAGVLVYITKGYDIVDPKLSDGSISPLFCWLLAVFWIPAGSAICVWGEFVLRMQTPLSYSQLLSLDPSRWNPGQRVLITVGIGFIFAFLLAVDVVQIGLGGLLLNDFSSKNPFYALAVGGITGLSFTAVKDIIFRMRPEERK